MLSPPLRNHLQQQQHQHQHQRRSTSAGKSTSMTGMACMQGSKTSCPHPLPPMCPSMPPKNAEKVLTNKHRGAVCGNPPRSPKAWGMPQCHPSRRAPVRNCPAPALHPSFPSTSSTFPSTLRPRIPSVKSSYVPNPAPPSNPWSDRQGIVIRMSVLRGRELTRN